MNKAFLFFLMFNIIGCKSNQINTTLSTLDKSLVFNNKKCISNAICTIEIIPDSNLIFTKDKLNNGSIKIENGKNTVIKYQLKKNKIPNTADSNYIEIIYLEIDNYNKTLVLKDKELQQVKMIYGRLCYCKGTSGYFKVKKGNLKLILKKNELTLDTNFSVENIPQIITQIHEKITLKK